MQKGIKQIAKACNKNAAAVRLAFKFYLILFFFCFRHSTRLLILKFFAVAKTLVPKVAALH